MSNWDQESDAFRGSDDDFDRRVADNVLVAWPSMLELIRSHLSVEQKLCSLDLGCGTGWLCMKLAGLGFDVTGVDPSEKMLEIARSTCPPSIRFIQGDCKTVSSETKYDLVVSCMAFPFIADVRELALHLNRCLKPEGLMVFAVFNPAFERACSEASVLFYSTGPERAWDYELQLSSSERFPVYSRNLDGYRKVFESSGFEFLESDVPDYPPGFLEEYVEGLPADPPEFLVCAFRKSRCV